MATTQRDSQQPAGWPHVAAGRRGGRGARSSWQRAGSASDAALIWRRTGDGAGLLCAMLLREYNCAENTDGGEESSCGLWGR